MIIRREMVCGALAIIWDSLPCFGQTRSRDTFGCALSDSEASAFFAAVTDHQLANSNRIIAKSGNSEFDYALAQTLSRMSDTLDVLPSFAYFDDFDGANAYASPRKLVLPSDGSVLFGKRLFLKIMSQQEHPDVGITAVCAHEFGHILQFKYDLRDVFQEGARVKRKELHADFLAGYYAGQRKLLKSDYPAAVFATQQESVGDPHVDHAQHHGRPDERATAIVRGFEVAYNERRGLAEAIQTGINFVMSF